MQLSTLPLPALLALDAQFSEQQKDNAVQRFMQLGTLSAVAAEQDVPLPLLRHWSQQEWWQVAVAFLDTERELGTESRILGLIDQSLGVIEKRLHYGDEVILSDGTPVSRMVSARDTATVMSTLLEHRKQIKRRVENNSLEQRNAALAKLGKRLEVLGARLGIDLENADGDGRDTGTQALE